MLNLKNCFSKYGPYMLALKKYVNNTCTTKPMCCIGCSGLGLVCLPIRMTSICLDTILFIQYSNYLCEKPETNLHYLLKCKIFNISCKRHTESL